MFFRDQSIDDAQQAAFGHDPAPDVISLAAERHRAGVAFAARLARAALDAGAPGLHLYTFNEHRAALDLLEHVDLPRVPHVPVALEDLLLPA